MHHAVLVWPAQRASHHQMTTHSRSKLETELSNDVEHKTSRYISLFPKNVEHKTSRYISLFPKKC